MWQPGGDVIPGTKKDFGVTSATENGPLFCLAQPAANFQPTRAGQQSLPGLIG